MVCAAEAGGKKEKEKKTQNRDPESGLPLLRAAVPYGTRTQA